MKTRFILPALILTLVCGAFSLAAAAAQTGERQHIRIGKQKRFSSAALAVRFVSVVEDSRCPEGANCIWAGNARIKIEVGKGREKETFELNTGVGAKEAVFKGYKIELLSLTPAPKENASIDRDSYVASFAVSRLTK